MSGRPLVMTIVCSYWAVKIPGLVTRVQPSPFSETSRAPDETKGSIVMTWFSFRIRLSLLS